MRLRLRTKTSNVANPKDSTSADEEALEVAMTKSELLRTAEKARAVASERQADRDSSFEKARAESKKVRENLDQVLRRPRSKRSADG